MSQMAAEMNDLHDGLSARERRRHAKNEQIVTASTELFLAEGYRAVSMDRLVDAAGVSKRTMYAYYDSKEKLFIAVVKAQLAQLWPTFEQEIRDDSSLEESLNEIGQKFSTLIMSDSSIALARTIIAETVHFPELAKAVNEVSFETLMERVSEILERKGQHLKLSQKEILEAAESFLDHLLSFNYMRTVFGLVPPLRGKKLKDRVTGQVQLFLSSLNRR